VLLFADINYDVTPSENHILYKTTDETIEEYADIHYYYENNSIHLAMVACGEPQIAWKAMILVNSAVLLSHSKLYFHVIIERKTRKEFITIVKQLKYMIFSVTLGLTNALISCSL
jgi:hypothetical protein